MSRGSFRGGGRILSIRGGCEPEIEITFANLVDTNNIINSIEQASPFQTGDIIVGVDETSSEPKTEVTIRALKKEVELDDINEMVNKLSGEYNIEEKVIKSSIEGDEVRRMFGNIF